MPDQKYIDPIHRPRERRDSTARANGLDTTANQPAPPTATLDPFEWASPRWDQDDTTVARPDVPEDLRGDTDKSVAFLEMLPRPWQLPAIIPDPVIDPQTGRKVPMPPMSPPTPGRMGRASSSTSGKASAISISRSTACGRV